MEYFTSTGYSVETCNKTNSMHILPPSPDSGQNSLEYWDYAVELEMLNGNNKVEDDLELAANLGKALLIANRKLETEVNENQIIIDDQSQEINYLAKQTSALREANESRLKIYEQLEISIQDLEQTNQRFKAESSTDKKKIKALLETVEQLEVRCEKLHKDLDENADQRGRSRTKSHAKDERYRRSLSCENSLRVEGISNEEDLRSRLVEVETKYKDAQDQRLLEVRRRDDLEINLACTTQDNYLLREQLAVFQEREDVLKSIEEDFSSIDDTSSGFCRKCNNLLETESNHTLQDMDEIEEDDIDNIRGPCSLFRLKNGGFAYGSQESLGSLGRLMNSEELSPNSVIQTESQTNSLFSELNVEYWSAMNKCEKVIKQREGQSNNYTNGMGSNIAPCNRCSTCTCDSRPDLRPKSILEEFSEVESASSGFSEPDNKTMTKFTQTEEQADEITPTVSYKPIVDSCESSSSTQGLPEYRKILHEVYYNIKQIVDHDKLRGFKPTHLENEELTTVQKIIPENLKNVESMSSEMPTTFTHELVKPQRPVSLQIEPRSVNRQKRKKRSKKPSIDNRGGEKIMNEAESLIHTQQTTVENQSPDVESPKNASINRKERSRKGCPHKIRNKNTTRYQISDKRPTADKPSNETSKIAHPSVEVAKLRKLEMTYAQALKNSNVNRHSNIKK